MTPPLSLSLYNSLTRQSEPFTGPRDGTVVRIYTCGPTVYNYQHIGNMRAFLFADTLGRALRWNGFATKHVINITDVGHLTSDADAGADKMEQAAAAHAKSIWDVAAYYTQTFKADVRRLNIVEPAEWMVATDHIPQMIDFARSIEGSCYRLDSGLYFDTSTVPHYGSLARTRSDDGESRIEPVGGKRHPQDFAIWRTSAPGEQRQMEWDSPWGRGAPGWHLECSVMSLQHLGHPFDIHTGGIDHREIHHPNEIAQNQAYCGCADTGATWWMHNNFLVDRRGKMSKSSGEFLTLQRLVDRGYHPLAYRLMCLAAHYRSELEFTWEGLHAALVRLKRIVGIVEQLRDQAPEVRVDPGDGLTEALAKGGAIALHCRSVWQQIEVDLATPAALSVFEAGVHARKDQHYPYAERLEVILRCDGLFGLELGHLRRTDLRLRPADAVIDEAGVEVRLSERREARAAKDYKRSDAIREELAAAGVEVMDGDPLGWDWKLAG